MSCLQHCGDCKCVETGICLPPTEREAEYKRKLQILKDYSCVLSQTTCVNLPQRVGQYAYFSWCYLQDVMNSLINLDKRVDNLCGVVKCQENKLNLIYDYLIDQAKGNVAFAMKSGGSTGADGDTSTYTKVSTTPDGGFTINWNMVWGKAEVGKGTITGTVNHSYTVNDDGSMQATISGFTIHRAVYTLSGGSADHHSASFSIFDNDGTLVYKRNYDPTQAWSETINKTVPLNVTKKVPANGGTTGDIPILTTLDDWLTNDTRGRVSAIYTNNNKPILLNNTPCNIKCGACENK